jgi:uncharacterized repeat protein (TIGR03803 family)
MLAVIVCARPSSAQTYEVIDTFVPNAFGRVPLGTLLLAPDGFFYGTASRGGAYDQGTVFRVDASGSFTVLPTAAVRSQSAF